MAKGKQKLTKEELETILSSGESELTTAIGLTYSACPNGAAVIGNEPSSTHST